MSPIDYITLMNAHYQSQGFSPYRWSVYETSPWTPLKKPLEQCRMALHTSGGVSRKDQPLFDPISYNDLSYREISKDTPVADLVISDAYYDHSDADKDINCIFPIERFRELEAEGYIGELAPTAYSGPSGRIYLRTALQQEVVPEIVGKLKQMEVDVLFLIGG